MLALLLLIDVALLTLHPLKYVTAPRYIPLDQNSVVSKIPAFFDSNDRPNSLLIGSSLPMQAIALWDAEYCRTSDPTTLEQVRLYTHARYLEKQLSTALGWQLNIFNLTCVGCMASDAYLLLTRAVDAGKAPRVVFWGIAPRDFVDNTVPAVGKTPVYEVLADWRCLNDILSSTADPEEIRDFAISYLWYFYKVKADYRTLITTVTCDMLNRQANLYFAVDHKRKDKDVTVFQRSNFAPGALCATSNAAATRLSPFKRSLQEYDGRYNPPNLKRLDDEIAYFRKALKLCRKNHIKLIVVNMPLTSMNRKLLAPTLTTRYRDQVLSAARQEASMLIDLDNDNFTDADFADSAHTNATGGRKVQDRMICELLDHRASL